MRHIPSHRSLLVSLAATLGLLAGASSASAQTVTETYTLDNVWLLPEAGSWDSVQLMTGSFEWTYTPGDFENGAGQFLDVNIPYYGTDLGGLNVTVETSSIEFTLAGNFHDLGVDISLFLLPPLAAGQASALDLTRCTYDIQQGVSHKGTMQSGDILPVASGVSYCFGDGSGGTCPCGATGSAGQGCLNSSGSMGATLGASGQASISNDTFQLTISGVPGSKPGLILRGINALNGGLGNPAGDGLLCVSGQTARSHVQVTSSGGTVFANFSGSPFGASSYGAGVATHYQFWYRDPGNTCSGSGFNFTNACEVLWMP